VSGSHRMAQLCIKGQECQKEKNQNDPFFHGRIPPKIPVTA
jgi:hypothetical protein